MTDDSRIVTRFRFVPDTFDSLARMEVDPDGEWMRYTALPAPRPSLVIGHRPMTGPSYLGNPHDSPIWEELSDALDKAMTKHAPMNSPHEGWSVIFEELEELREHVRGDTGRTAEARKEAIQVAAMGLRYALDLCSSDTER